MAMETNHDLDVSVKLKNGDALKFEPYENGLCYLDLDKLMNDYKPINLVNNYCL